MTFHLRQGLDISFMEGIFSALTRISPASLAGCGKNSVVSRGAVLTLCGWSWVGGRGKQGQGCGAGLCRLEETGSRRGLATLGEGGEKAKAQSSGVQATCLGVPRSH